MKLTLITAAVLAGTALLPAAEKAPFSYHLSSSSERISSDKPVTAEAPVCFSPDKESKFGPCLTITLKDPEPETMYRIRADFRTSERFHYRDLLRSPEKWPNCFPAGKGVMTFYIMSGKQRKAVAAMSFPKNCGKVEIRELSVEKIAPGEYQANLLCGDGLEPGFWYGHWGARDNCIPILKKDSDSPFGTILHFPASADGDGHKTTLPLPFLPDRNYVLSFWVRSDTPATLSCQVAFGNIGFTRFAVKKEWTQVKLTAKTPAQAPESGMWLMFLNLKNQILPAFELGGVDFRYVNPESK